MGTGFPEIATLLLVLAGLLLVMYAIRRGFILYKQKQYVREWQPLISMVNGTLINNGEPSAEGYLTGNYHGHLIQACLVPESLNPAEGNTLSNYFEISLQQVTGRYNWTLACKTPAGGNTHCWQILADNKHLVDQLQSHEVTSLLSAMGRPTVLFHKREGMIRYCIDVPHRKLPEPALLKQQLELLLRLKQINEEVNTL